MAAGLESRTTSSASPANYSDADTLVAHKNWENTVLQAWQDSVAELLTRREPDKEDRTLDALAAALEAGRTMVALDPETGEFVRAHWYLPVYRGERRAQALRRRLQEITQGLDLPPKEEQPFRKPTDPLWQPVPLLSGLVSYSLEKPLDQRNTPVPFDPIHRFGMHPYREVLEAEELKNYPVVLLGYIDPKDRRGDLRPDSAQRIGRAVHEPVSVGTEKNGLRGGQTEPQRQHTAEQQRG